MLRQLDRGTPLLTNSTTSTATLSATSRLKARRKPGFFLWRRSVRKRNHVGLQGAARHAFESAKVGVRFGRMRLDANESGGLAAFGAGRTEIGRALRDVDLKCAHATTIHPLKNYAINTF